MALFSCLKKLLTSLNDIFIAVFITLLIGGVQLIKNNKMN
jgi:hypothetical protein